MTVKSMQIDTINGLDEKDILPLREIHGDNSFYMDPPRRIFFILWDIAREPMFILLIIACVLYFFLGKPHEGIMMAIAMALVGGISVYQEVRSNKALEALKQYTEPRVIVIRNSLEKIIASKELVPGDVIVLSEGNNVPADAIILRQNDLTVNESIITGESLPAEKNESGDKNILYQGTTINSGRCYA
ncbi:MAG: HAD-IC family P-type ATPase, partial [Bacteroidota bacterium]